MFERNGGRAEQASIVAEFAQTDEGAGRRAVGERVHGVAGGAKEHFAHREEAATEGDQVRIEDVDEAAEGETKEVSPVADLGLAESIAACGGRSQVGRGGRGPGCNFREQGRFALLDEFARAFGEGDAADHGLETAARAAVTAGTCRVENDVSNFAGEPPGSTVEAPVDHNPATDAGAQGRVEEVARAPAGAKSELAKGGSAGVVFNVRGDAETLGHRGGEHQVAEARDVRRDDDLPLFGVDEPGCGDTGRGRGFAGRGDRVREEFDDPGNDCLGRRPGRCRVIVAVKDVPFLRDDGRAQVGTTEICREDGTSHRPTLPKAGVKDEGAEVAAGLRVRQARSVFERWQLELLDACRVARLGTIAPDGRPRLLPVCYALAGEAVVMAVDEKPKRGGRLARLRDIERDARVSLLVDRYDDDWTRLAWVRVEGTATVMARGSEHPAALDVLRGRYTQYRDMRLEELPLIALVPKRVVGWRWAEQR